MSKLKIFCSCCLFLLAICLVPPRIFAHVTGQTVENRVGDYLVDIGYDIKDITVGQSVTFDFNLLTPKKDKEITFTDVWVRVVSDKQTVFASGIHRPPLGKSGMIFTFPFAGTYTVFVRFEDADKNLAETQFNLSVSDIPQPPPPKKLPIQFFVIGASFLGLIIGIIMGITLKIKQKNESATP